VAEAELPPVSGLYRSEAIGTQFMPGNTTPPRIPPKTRHAILDALRVSGVKWRGKLTDEKFLARIYDLEKLPSYDHRYPTASRDIWKHMTDNRDWEEDWVLTDRRFNLVNGPDSEFLQFLARVIHPAVRDDSVETAKAIAIFNEALAGVGYSVRTVAGLGGVGEYSFQEILSPNVEAALGAAERAADILSNEYLRTRTAALRSISTAEPSAIIAAAKEMLESACKEILSRKGKATVQKDPSLSQLVKQTAAELRLVPPGAEFDQAKQPLKSLLTSLAGASDAIGLIRNAFGEGHGKDSKFKQLEQAHAGLVLEASAALTEFLIMAWLAQEPEP